MGARREKDTLSVNEDLHAALTGIYQAHGRLTAAVVLQEAANPKHPLHSRFEWDDTIAARKYREGQAGDMIRSVRISYVTDTGEETKVRAFYPVSPSVATRAAATYRPIEELDSVERQVLLRSAKREWEMFKRRYEALQEFFGQIEEEAAAIARSVKPL